MGKSNPTIGFWYKVAYHMGLCYGPIDAFLEMRCGPKTAWSGKLTASGTINIDKPQLFGGETDQGGIAGDLDVMFGDADATPNAYLQSVFGPKTSTYRGIATVAFKGGKYGALNPYPQKPAYLVLKTKAGWDAGCWYPEKAEIDVSPTQSLPPDATGWEYQQLPAEVDPGHSNLEIPTSGWTPNAQAPFAGGGYEGMGNTNWDIGTVLWVRRQVSISGRGQKLRIDVDNGAAIFINGQLVRTLNADNAQKTGDWTAEFDLNAGEEYDIAIKAFDETPTGPNTILKVSISAPGLIAINPAHALYYARTQSHLGRSPVAEIDDASFRAAADWFHAQRFGICVDYDSGQESPTELIQRIEDVAGCTVTRSAVDGKFYLDVADGVYDFDALPVLTDDDILDFEDQPALPDKAVNSLSVQYFDVQLKTDRTTVPIEALGLIDQFGTIHQDKDYREIPTSAVANWAAARDIKSVIGLTHGFQITTTRKPYAWRRNTYFRLQSPRNGIADMVCLVGTIDTGTLRSGAIKLTAAQNVWSAPDTVYIGTENGVDTRPPQTPIPVTTQAVIELPYIMLAGSLTPVALDQLTDDASFLGALALAPDHFRDYAIAVATRDGATYTIDGRGPWTPTATVNTTDDLGGAAPVTDVTLVAGDRLADVLVGSAALWGEEIVRVDAIDAVAGTATLGRGCGDTVPAAHAGGERIWFYDGYLGTDRAEYVDGEDLDVKLLTASGSAQLEPSQATALAITMQGRAALPYPPGKFRINGNFSPSAASGAITITWASRNRLTQADQLVDSGQSAITPDAMTRYAIQLHDADDNLLVEKLDVDPTAGTATATADYTGDLTITLYAINGNGESLQHHKRTVDYTPPANPINTITADAWTAPTWTIDGNEAT